jgi:hypothetical protein
MSSIRQQLKRERFFALINNSPYYESSDSESASDSDFERDLTQREIWIKDRRRKRTRIVYNTVFKKRPAPVLFVDAEDAEKAKDIEEADAEDFKEAEDVEDVEEANAEDVEEAEEAEMIFFKRRLFFAKKAYREELHEFQVCPTPPLSPRDQLQEFQNMATPPSSPR